MDMTTLTQRIKEAMKARDAVTLETLRFILSQIKYKQIELQHELSTDEITQVLNGEIKKRTEAISLFRSSGREELATEEEAKVQVITSLLPPQLSDDELTAIVREVVASEAQPSMGSVMKAVMAKVAGKAAGNRVSAAVKQALENQ